MGPKSKSKLKMCSASGLKLLGLFLLFNIIPQAKAVKCDTPEEVENGRASFPSELDYDSIVTYHCNQGFSLIGNTSRRCNEKGVWSDSAPACKEVNCGRPEITNGICSGQHPSHFAHDKSVSCQCNTGYELTTSNNAIRCQENGRWTPFHCKAVKCDTPEEVENGRVSFPSELDYDSIVTYHCNQGFSLIGNTIRRCNEKGVWSDSAPACKEVNCGRPEITNGICSGQHPSHFAHDKSVSCQCNTGYELTTSNNAIRCQENGRWTPFHCKAVKCDTPEEVENGRVSFPSELDYDSIVTYHCNQGFSLIGNTIRRCNEKGVWSDSAPACKELKSTKDVLQKLSTEEKKCKKIALSENLKIDANVGSRVHFYCDEGYTLFGSNEIECLPTIEWSIEKAPICKPVVCDQLDIQNGSLNVSLPVQFNTFIGYSCNENYVLVGNQTIECLRTGKLSSEKPYCKTITCDSPAEGPHLISSFPSRLEFGSEITYTCENEMTLNGPSTRICQANGTWSGKDPVCVFNCPPPPEPWQGYWIGNDYSLGSSITLKCNKGYMVAGSDQQTCQEDQTWYPSQSPTCQRTCDQPIDPFGRLSDQHKSKNVFTQGDIVRVTCSNRQPYEGYNLQCYDGQWAPPGSLGAFRWNTCGGFCLRPPSQVKATLSPRFTYKNMYNVDDYLYFDCDSSHSRRRGYYLYCRQDHTKQTNWVNDCGREPCCS